MSDGQDPTTRSQTPVYYHGMGGYRPVPDEYLTSGIPSMPAPGTPPVVNIPRDAPSAPTNKKAPIDSDNTDGSLVLPSVENPTPRLGFGLIPRAAASHVATRRTIIPRPAVSRRPNPTSQLEDIHRWLRENNHAEKLERLPAVNSYTFASSHSVVQAGRRPECLLLGLSSTVQIWAVLSTTGVRYIDICQVTSRTGNETILHYFPAQDINLLHPFQAFRHNGTNHAWLTLKVLIGYIFLQRGVVDRIPLATLLPNRGNGLGSLVAALNTVCKYVGSEQSESFQGHEVETLSNM